MKSYKTSRSKIRENLHDLVFGYEFLDTTSKVPFMKEKKYFIKTKNICSMVDTIKSVKRQARG